MSVEHSTFTIDRTFEAPPNRVFQAFADPVAKKLWFGGPEEWNGRGEMDFRVGGKEWDEGDIPDGPRTRFDATYYDIVDNERIVYCYEMYLDDKRISVSVSTIELTPAGSGTRFVLTEHGAYLDGHDFPAQREHGTRELMDALEKSLTVSV